MKLFFWGQTVRRENGGVGQGYFFAVACKTSVATGCLQTLMTECSHGRVSVNSELGPRAHDEY